MPPSPCPSLCPHLSSIDPNLTFPPPHTDLPHLPRHPLQPGPNPLQSPSPPTPVSNPANPPPDILLSRLVAHRPQRPLRRLLPPTRARQLLPRRRALAPGRRAAGSPPPSRRPPRAHARKRTAIAAAAEGISGRREGGGGEGGGEVYRAECGGDVEDATEGSLRCLPCLAWPTPCPPPASPKLTGVVMEGV